MVVINSEKYGETTMFETLEEAERALNSIDEGWGKISIMWEGENLIDQDGDIIGYETHAPVCCGHPMVHSSAMENPGDGDFWQCEYCGDIREA